MIRLDLHIHSKYSYDSISEPEDIVKIAKAKGLHGIAITDHNTIRGGLAAKRYEDNSFVVIVGSEISTLEGEIIGLFLKKEIPGNLSIIETINKIHKQGGLAIIPHPFDIDRKFAVQRLTENILKLIDGVETLNARSKTIINKNTQGFVNENNLKEFAGSDAHTLLEIGSAGIDINTKSVIEDQLKKAITNNRLMIYQKYVPKIFYRPFDIVGKQLKKRKINSKFLFRILNTVQYIFI